jgi:Fic family protein
MDINRFAGSPIGSLIPISGTDGRTGETYDHFAFAAEPLDGPPELTTETWNRVTAASRALGRLQHGARLVTNPGLLRRPTLRREAQSTSALEGTYAPLDEVLAADIIATENRSSALSEVMNFVTAAERGFDWVDEGRAITSGLLCELHRILVRGTPADNEEAGRIRRLQVVIGSRSGSVYDSRFIPMPEGPQLVAGVGDLIDWMATGHTSIDPIVAAAMSHYQFETLHPFNDGNGRIGRLLIVLQLVKDGVLEQGLLSVSPWFEQRRDEYQELLAEVSASGDWSPWVGFFAQGIEASAIDTARRIERLMDLQLEFHESIRTANFRGLIRDVADILIGTPYVTIPNLRDQTGATYQAANVVVQRLMSLGILEQVPSTGTMVFRAPAVLRILSA